MRMTVVSMIETQQLKPFGLDRGFTDLFSRYRLIGIDIHHIGIGVIGNG